MSNAVAKIGDFCYQTCIMFYILMCFEYVNVNILCSKNPKPPRSTSWDDFIIKALV